MNLYLHGATDTPPQGRADYAFQQHILQSLRPKTERCAVLWPHGVLFRQEEAEMRRKLIEADLIECVLVLGPNLFYNSPMEACVVVCRTQKPKARRGSSSSTPSTKSPVNAPRASSPTTTSSASSKPTSGSKTNPAWHASPRSKKSAPRMAT